MKPKWYCYEYVSTFSARITGCYIYKVKYHGFFEVWSKHDNNNWSHRDGHGVWDEASAKLCKELDEDEAFVKLLS